MIELRDAVVLAETFDKLSAAYAIWLMLAPKVARWLLMEFIAVSRVAIENAVSVSLLMLTTDALLVEVSYREDDPRVAKIDTPKVMMKKHG